MVEKIIGIIDNVYPRLSWASGIYNIVFTTERMIFANAIGFLNEWHTTWWYRYAIFGSYFEGKKLNNITKIEAEKMKNSNPDDILNSNKHNFQIPYNKVIKIEMLRLTQDGSKIRIYTDGKTYKYQLGHVVSNSFKDWLWRSWRGDFISKEIFDDYTSIIRSAVHDKLFILYHDHFSKEEFKKIFYFQYND